MRNRWGKSPENLPDSHPGWDLETNYLARALVNLIYTYSPQRVVLGGGVSQHPGLIEAVRCKIQQLINNYVQSWMLLDGIHTYLVPPALGNRSGGLGAMAMARALIAGSCT
jgi:fructokinase